MTEYIFESAEPITRCGDCWVAVSYSDSRYGTTEGRCKLGNKKISRFNLLKEKPGWCPLTEVKE